MASEEVQSGSDVVLTIAKWLVPSIGALAVLIGYVIESAHQSLLGIDLGALGVNAYVWSAGTFIRDFFTLIIALPFSYSLYSFGLDWETLFGLICILLPAVRLLPRRFIGAHLISVLLIGLCVLALWRIAFIDLPASRVMNVLITGSSSVDRMLIPDRNASFLERVVLGRATRLYAAIVCKRPGTVEIPELKIHCDKDYDYATQLKRLFLLTVLSSVVFALLVLFLWTRTWPVLVTFLLGPIAIYTVFSPIYVYGKFLRATEYETAVVQLKSAIVNHPSAAMVPFVEGSPERSAERSSKSLPTNLDSSGFNVHLLVAIILSRGDKRITLYVSHPVPCPPNQVVVYEWRLWEASAAEIVLIRDISYLDVIEEKLKQQSCAIVQPSQ